jgi:hypothetical protein
LVNIASGFGVMLGRADAAAPGHAQHHRAGEAAAGAGAQARGVADEVVDHRVHEAVELRFGHGLHALRRHADAEAGDRGFVQRRVEHALGAEALLQAGRGAEHAAVDADVLAQQQHALVVRDSASAWVTASIRVISAMAISASLACVPSQASASARCAAASAAGSA